MFLDKDFNLDPRKLDWNHFENSSTRSDGGHFRLFADTGKSIIIDPTGTAALVLLVCGCCVLVIFLIGKVAKQMIYLAVLSPAVWLMYEHLNDINEGEQISLNDVSFVAKLLRPVCVCDNFGYIL